MVYGKVAKVEKTGGSVEYRYDAAGNRIVKRVKIDGQADKVTHYVRDASGNMMGVYKETILAEQHVYGSSRLGLYKGGNTANKVTFGNRQFELSNHLGNVLAVITDHQKIPESDYYLAKVISTSDYFPFGLAMEARGIQDDEYRFSFNGKENDKDFGNKQLIQDYGFRIYNPAIGKFLSVDPLTKEFPWYTPYQFAGNKPIEAIDLDGAEEKRVVQSVTGTRALIRIMHLNKFQSRKDYKPNADEHVSDLDLLNQSYYNSQQAKYNSWSDTKDYRYLHKIIHKGGRTYFNDLTYLNLSEKNTRMLHDRLMFITLHEKKRKIKKGDLVLF